MIQWPFVLVDGLSGPGDGACAMAAISWLVEGKHSDLPECASFVISVFVAGGNDAMDAITRQRLIPYLHRIAGSRDAFCEKERERLLLTKVLEKSIGRCPNAYNRPFAIHYEEALDDVAETFLINMIDFRDDWNEYFQILDEALKMGAEGEPWSAEVMEIGVARYRQAGGKTDKYGSPCPEDISEC